MYVAFDCVTVFCFARYFDVYAVASDYILWISYLFWFNLFK